MSYSPQLRALGPGIRILNALIDALILGAELEDMWDHPLVKTAIKIESGNRDGFNEDSAARTLKSWGVVDQHGVYVLAGLTKRQREVAFMFFDRQLEPNEIGKYLGLDAHTVRVHLQAAEERLRRLAA